MTFETYRVGQRVLVKGNRGVREAIIRSLDRDVAVIDLDPPLNGPAGASLALRIEHDKIIGPVVTKR
jgi:FKBP-type peptidyl-prolyl cis-trans isomerase 2